MVTLLRVMLGVLILVCAIAPVAYISWHQLHAGGVGFDLNIVLALNIAAAFSLIIFLIYVLRRRNQERSLKSNIASLERRIAQHDEELYIAHEEVKKSQANLFQAEKMTALGQLVAGIAHEINTPLAYSRSNVVMVNEQLHELRLLLDETHAFLRNLSDDDKLVAALRLNPKMLEQLDLVVEHTSFLRDNEVPVEMGMLLEASKAGMDQIATLVRDLKDFSRLDRKRAENIDLNNSLDSALSIARNNIKYKAEVIKNYGELPPVPCSPSQINQVFLNLLVNAAQAIEERGTITLTTLYEDGCAKIMIKDDGVGIAADVLPNIFDPFYTTKPLGEGTGLGLSIVYQIIEQHGGKIAVDSDIGQGTCFTLTLPISSKSGQVQTTQAASA